MHEHSDMPYEWVERWGARLPRGAHVLDLACGNGRHARWFAERGHTVHAVDRNRAGLASLRDVPRVTTLCADLEGAPWPLDGGTYGAVVVTNYLHRPIFADIVSALAPGGALIYETFAAGNEKYGRPSNPDFLLKPGELLHHVRGRLRAVAYEEVLLTGVKPAVVQRIYAIR